MTGNMIFIALTTAILAAPCVFLKTMKKCFGLKPIEELTIHSKTSFALENIVRDFQKLGRTLMEMRQVTNQNLKILQSQKLDIQNKIKTLRGEINKHLDRIESNLLSKVDALCNEQKGHIEKLRCEIKMAKMIAVMQKLK